MKIIFFIFILTLFITGCASDYILVPPTNNDTSIFYIDLSSYPKSTAYWNLSNMNGTYNIKTRDTIHMVLGGSFQ